MKQASTSVIVVSYNSCRYLPACLSAIVQQLGPDDELIVVDNSSTDGSAALVQTQFPQARLVCAPNEGYAGGNNRGAAVARGEVLVFLNPDTVVYPHAIAALVQPLCETQEIGMTTACLVYMGAPERVNTCGNTMHYTGLTYCRGANQPRARYATPADVDAVSGAAFAIRRDLFDQLGGFDSSFFMYVEDTDLSLRARLAGYRCRYVPDAVVEHDYHPSYTPSKAFYLDRNRHSMLLKNLSRGTYMRLLPGLLLAEVVTTGFLLLKGPRFWGVKARVYRALWQARGRAGYGQSSHLQERVVMQQMTYQLEFEQLAGRGMAMLAGALFHPAFQLFQRLGVGGRI
ncbi:MAG: glycosyltransferase family 2 protein [Chloroflexaceae bacterium]|nr:glycosyltransferase family 2 protein [Chloroflexaceae bacterium]